MILACVFLIVSKWKHCQIWRNKVYLRQCNQCFLTTFDSWFNSRGEETKRLDLKTPPSALEICFFILTSHCRPGKTYQSIKMYPFSVTHTQREKKKKKTRSKEQYSPCQWIFPQCLTTSSTTCPITEPASILQAEKKRKKLENKKTGALRGDVYDKYISSFT